MASDTNLRHRMRRLAQWIFKLVYRMLPADVCTRLACGRIGRTLGPWLAPVPHEALYQCDFGIKLRLTREDAVVGGFAYMGQSNPFETRLVNKFLNPGDTLVQIGAYKDGWLALVGARAVGSEGTVVCFEPIPDYAESFRQNVALNDFRNIAVEQVAVSDVPGRARLSLAGTNSSLVLAGKSASVDVNAVTLDEYVASRGLSKIDLLIVDVEGAEPLVLRGAQRTLETSVSLLLMEVIDEFLRQAGSSALELIRYAMALGFHPYVITRRGLRAWKPGCASETLNMFFSKRDLMADDLRW
ncbi:MAG: FkbM family methyltransferase [Kiritimatiellae bacterium]|nr:FkbM family methyltransferase [Kiritimatiellia bacterium]